VQFSSNKEYLDTKDLCRFLEAEQGMAHDTALKLIQAHEPSAQGRQQAFLSLDGFSSYLTSPECHLFDRDHKLVCQDMSQPLSHYFISASHNTYLIEDQYRGPSDLSGYIRALRMGCRCVEVDVWDGDGDEPLVCAGHTLSPPLVFHCVLEAIGRFAFVSSDYPLILCLENHCSLRQQKVMVGHLLRILGDKLYRDEPKEGDMYLPSPQQKNVSLNELSDLVTLCSSVHFVDFQTSSRTQKPWEMCSLHEALALRLAGENPGDFVNHNKHYLTRVYPSPMRVDSSNMNPLDLWKCGCQLVAMNFQTAGLMMDLVAAWFRQNGNCGYVLRPEIMRQEVSYFSADTRDSVPGVSPQLLHIKVISGQNLPKPKGSGAKGDVVDPYVYVEVHGIPADCTERRTRTVTHNGDNPIFDESFDFQINLPELAMVRFVVLDDHFIGDEFIGGLGLGLDYRFYVFFCCFLIKTSNVLFHSHMVNIQALHF
uniref:Phosphoinositide phospholipase C n=1 Tax=Periophthalmus magnuspinnatus TaxID=409849 RepID=A0A3B3ZSN0_9GOBI